MTTSNKAKKRASHHAHTDAEDADRSGGRLIKYMGASHVRVLEAGEDFGGRLHNSPLPQRVEWNLANNHMVNSEEVGLSAAALEILLDIDGDQFDSGQWEDADEEGYEEPSEGNTVRAIKEFRDVTDDENITPSLAQQIFLGMSKQQTADEAIRDMEAGIQPANPAARSVMHSDQQPVATVHNPVSEEDNAAVADGAQQSGSPDAGATTTVGGSTDGETGGGAAPTTTVGGSTSGVGGDQ